jgi:hypothetical protein
MLRPPACAGGRVGCSVFIAVSVSLVSEAEPVGECELADRPGFWVTMRLLTRASVACRSGPAPTYTASGCSAANLPQFALGVAREIARAEPSDPGVPDLKLGSLDVIRRLPAKREDSRWGWLLSWLRCHGAVRGYMNRGNAATYGVCRGRLAPLSHATPRPGPPERRSTRTPVRIGILRKRSR